jgi:hypothetical protein
LHNFDYPNLGYGKTTITFERIENGLRIKILQFVNPLGGKFCEFSGLKPGEAYHR